MPNNRNKKMATKQQVLSRRKTLCQELYQQCLIPNDQFKYETTFTKIYEIIEQINEEEKNIPFCAARDRSGLDFENFLKFLNENNCETEKILKICKNDKYDKDFSLVAKKSLNKGELVFSVPDNLIFTTSSLGENKLKELTKQDKMLLSMPNVALALAVLFAKQNNDKSNNLSKWSPYFNILPSEFNTPLYFSQDEIKSLKNSQSFVEIMYHIRNIARIYAYTINLLESKEELKSFYDNFSFKNFRWAISAVSTRQNQIHDENNKPLLAMIPLLDMCNHEEGQFCTDYDHSTKSALCYAQKSLNIGDQITIFYGARTNLEMLVHNGFVCENNSHDRVKLKLSINNQDVLYEHRLSALKKFSLNEVELFEWDNNDKSYDKLLPKLYLFAKIFTSKTDQELRIIQSEHSGSAEEFYMHKNLLNDALICQFLTIRLSILIKSVDIAVKNCPKTTNGIFISRLLSSEKNLLEKLLNFLSNNKV